LFLARDAAAFVAIASRRPPDAVRHVDAELRARGHEPPLSYAILSAAVAGKGDFRHAREYAVRAESLLVDPRTPSKHEAAYLATAWAAAGDTARALRWLAAYSPLADLHYQLHLQRDPGLRWIAKVRPSLLKR